MDAAERAILRMDALSCFPRGEVGQALAGQAACLLDAAPDGEALLAAVREAQLAASYANNAYRANAWRHDGDLTEWFSLPEIGVSEIARRQAALQAEWQAALPDEMEEDEEDDPYWSMSGEEIREAYGRTLPFDPESSGWIWIRFGRVPESGVSRFGLAREDSEDGPDPWRLETGGMTHEAGLSVFRGRRHPDLEGCYIIEEPAYDLARYGVGGLESHLLAVIPNEIGEAPRAWLVRGTPATCRARDASLRCDLGSDGEYLLCPRTGVRAEEIQLGRVHVHRELSVEAFLLDRRGHLAAPEP